MMAGMWAPKDVELVNNALTAVLATPHLTKEQRESAEAVAERVRSDLSAVESGKLKGEARKAKVADAISALTSLQQEWDARTAKIEADEKASEEHMENLKKELEVKKTLLSKEEDQMKVIELEKDVLQKKLKLNTLVEAKRQAAEKKAKEQDEKERAQMFTDLTAVAAGKASDKVKKDTIESVNGRMKKIEDAMAALDTDEKETEKKMAALDGKDAKLKKMISSVIKKKHRQVAKAKAVKGREIADMKEAVKLIESNDTKKLTDIVKKMRKDVEDAEAKSGDFLH